MRAALFFPDDLERKALGDPVAPRSDVRPTRRQSKIGCDRAGVRLVISSAALSLGWLAGAAGGQNQTCPIAGTPLPLPPLIAPAVVCRAESAPWLVSRVTDNGEER